MDVPWFLLVLWAAVLVSLVLMAGFCVDCWNKGVLVSIRQRPASEEYMPSTEFRVFHPPQSSNDLNSLHCARHLLKPPRPDSAFPDLGLDGRHRSFMSTSTESNPSYENPADGPEYLNRDPNLPDSDAEDPGYIIVIPDGEGLAPSNQSQASTPSSDVRHEYVNIEGKVEKEEEEEEEEKEYLNVDPQQSYREEDDEDDDRGSYVNQPPMSDSQLTA